ncbi:MAG: pectinesterase [Ignavibacteria bacterium]|nr:MAG: pectinesterase [Ignavibacteria bacterium]KAF0161907.1 MAG: pectinesterase [Ignavibacteria bacterium]
MLIVFIYSICLFATEKRFITVAQDGSGDYKTITTAIQSLPLFNYQRTVIYVKNGVYNEKIRIDQDYITLRGESRENTILQHSQLRTDWVANKDSIGAAVINLKGDDFILENFTVENTQPEIGPHAFTIYGTGTRTILLNCNLLSKGGDTVSLWNYKTGMYYHANCYFVGAVDFVCPRGWCFIRSSKFFQVKKTASLWHAGGDNINQKFVIVNSEFDGIFGFELARHHYEAQFYLIDCTFSDNMSTRPIYRVTYSNEPERDRPFNWGHRYYFADNKSNVALDWNENNLNSAHGSPTKNQITAEWTFDGMWNPESNEPVKILSYSIIDRYLLLKLSEKVTVVEVPTLISQTGNEYTYVSGGGSDTLRFISRKSIEVNDLRVIDKVQNGSIFATSASIYERNLELRFDN